MKIDFRAFALAVAVAVAASGAQALTIDTNRATPTPRDQLAPNSNSIDFRLNWIGSDLTAPVPNSRSPWEEFPALIDSAKYNSVEANGFARYDFSTLQNSFSLMWGSPDSYNQLKFYNDDLLVDTVLGNNTAITSTPGFEAQRKFVNVIISGISSFNNVRFFSVGADAFEFANINAVPVPVPAGILFSLTAVLGGVGVSRLRARA